MPPETNAVFAITVLTFMGYTIIWRSPEGLCLLGRDIEGKPPHLVAIHDHKKATVNDLWQSLDTQGVDMGEFAAAVQKHTGD